MRPLIFPRLLAVFCAVQSFSSLSAQVVINEFLASNSSGLTDQDGDYSDWIEIYNSGGTAVNLQDWSLTDSPDQPAKWRFPKTSLAPNGYLLVFASGKDRAVAGAELHASFSLDAAGEYLALVRPDSVVASEFARAYPRQEKDVSYGLYQGSAYYFTRPSPAAANSSGFVGLVADTKFSHDRGFYEAPFELKITTETPDAIIYYTTNGKPPNATNGVVYTGPMQISATTVLRAAAFRSGYLPSKPDTQTYLFLDDIIHQSSDGRAPAGWPTSWGGNTVDYGMDPDVVNNPRYSATIKQDLQTIPSVSMVLDLNDLFSSSRGIYANPGQDGINWERPGSIELIYPDGRQGFQVNAGVRIRGGYSRSTGNPKHAFRLFFREEYGDAKLRFPLFGDAGTDTFDSIDLRTFQNYSWSFEGDSRGVFIRDVFSRDAQLAMGYQGERGDYCHLYINGR
ncbi:MAG: lamin tail domain-containing protein [Verrucomicrobiota bacterium]